MYKLYISRMITISILCCSLISGLCSVIVAATGPMATDPFGGMNSEALTPEKLQEFEAQLNAEIEDMVNKMDPKQKQIFDETVKRLEQKDPEELQRFVMGDMNDNEMEDFLKSVIPEEAMAEETEQEAPQPIVEAPQAEAPKPQFSSKHEKAKHLIETIIKHIQSFLDKTTEIPELENLIKQWKKQGNRCMPAISKQRSEDWATFKADIEKMLQQFHKLLDKDTKKDSYKFLEDFINNENLYYNMTQLRDTLVEQEPKVETPTFGSKELSDACKSPVQNVINVLGEALDELTIPRSLNVIFDKYEPTAKKHREDEQRATDKALQASKQKPGSNPMRSVGSEPRNPYASSYNSGYSNPWSSYSPSSSSSYSPSSSPSSDSSGSNNPFGNSGSSKTGSGGTKTPNAKDDKSDKEPAKDKNPGIPGETAPNKSDKNPTNGATRQPGNTPYMSENVDNSSKGGIVSEIEENIKKASDISNKLYKWTFTSDAVNSSLLTDDLPTLMAELSEANAKVNQIEQNHLTSNATKRKLQSIWRIYNGNSTTAPMGIAKLAGTIKEVKNDKTKLDDAHKEAYFFTPDNTAKVVDPSIKGTSLTVDQIKKIRTVSLDEIEQEITKLEKSITNLNASSSTPSPARRSRI